MNKVQSHPQNDLDKELTILQDLMKKENEMLRRMISSLDSLGKKMALSEKRRREKFDRG